VLILYVALEYDYGKHEQGYSFEHYNFYHSLLHMGYDILYFDFMTLMQEHGQEWMNRRLLEVAKAEKPDLMFTVLFRDELDPAAVRGISENTDTITLNWFCDDHWRFDNYSRFWAPRFNWVVTTARSALPKYAKIGCRNVIKSQWACNHFLYRKHDLPIKYDVTFVGQPHGNRRRVVQALRDAGINVQVWGTGWENGRLAQEEVIRVFNQSRINLNLSNASTPSTTTKERSRAMVRNSLSHCLDAVPFGSQVKMVGKKWISAMRRSTSITTSSIRSNSIGQQYAEQIKARNFEVPGCGGFLLTGTAEDLEDYYDIINEVVCFEDVDDLIRKVRYYLHHEKERAAIAQASHQRTLCEHTYVDRFKKIFQGIGLPWKLCNEVIEGKGRPGQTEEVQ
jgi:spore maturation protein CgeB